MTTTGEAHHPPVPSDPWAPFVSSVVGALEVALAPFGAVPERSTIERLLELSGESGREIALPVHRWARERARRPEELANELARSLVLPVGIRSVAAAGAFVNFSVDLPLLATRTLRLIEELGARYGGAERVSGPAACVEHTSANPTGPLHVGRIRNGIIGDSLARILRFAGTPVTTQYYADDLGRQSAMVTWIWSKPAADWPAAISAASAPPGEGANAAETADVRLGRPYPSISAYLKSDPTAAREVAELTESLESGHPPPQHRRFAEEILAAMLASVARIGIGFDEVVWESSLLDDGSVAKVVGRLEGAPHARRESNGALAIDASTYGLPKETSTVVVVRANGTSLYATRDVAYHLRKFDRFPRVIDVLGQDHQLHARTLEVLLTEIGEPRRPEFVIYQDLTVPEGGRMSTRKGTAVSLDALLDEAVRRATAEVRTRWPEAGDPEVEAIATALAAGAVRYHIVRVAPDKTVGFRWEEALSFEGRSGPFVQYAYVRATSLLRKAGPRAPFELPDALALSTEEELGLLRTLSLLPRTVGYAARTAHVHAVAGYAHDLAEAFNRFYQAVPVLQGGERREERLALVVAARATLGTSLDLLGLPRLERM